MQYFKSTLLALLALIVTSAGSVQAFSFNFSDGDDYPYWWGGSPFYRPWGHFYPPQLPHYDRLTMVRERQEMMGQEMDAMTRLRDLLYGKYGFDRAEAIQLARKIELTSGAALTSNFHPGAVRQYDSRTTPAYWGNEQTFKAHAEALKAAAASLAAELEKKPTEEQGAVYLSTGRTEYGAPDDKTPVSPAIFEKFNTLSNTCEGCHDNFRGHRWW